MTVLRPTPASVRPLISVSIPTLSPGNSILTYERIPLESSPFIPPYNASEFATAPKPPSSCTSEPILTGAFPQMTIPPQSPGPRAPAGRSLVKMIGWAAVPAAMMRPPRFTISDPIDDLSPRMIVPGSMISVANESTNVHPVSTYVVSADNTRVEPEVR